MSDPRVVPYADQKLTWRAVWRKESRTAWGWQPHLCTADWNPENCAGAAFPLTIGFSSEEDCQGFIDANLVDAVSSQYEQAAWIDQFGQLTRDRFFFKRIDREPNPVASRWEPLFRRIEYSADTRALIEQRTPAETAEVKAWSDDAHARIRAGEVSGSHDLMRAKVGEYRAGAGPMPFAHLAEQPIVVVASDPVVEVEDVE